MFERPRSGERALLVSVEFNIEIDQPDSEEFISLACSAGAIPLQTLGGKRQAPDAAYFIGKGKLEEIRALVVSEKADLVLFNHTLSPAQERNLERVLECRVLDRTGLILDIFAQRARSFEGKLQVELAQLQHLSTRLVRGWTHLERQKGGIGLRGPGETQLETDRRLLGERIKQIHRRLDKVRKQREQNRRARRRAELPTISLVGYTNAGKSTLFNALTEASVYTADQLFATLDPTLRRLLLPNKMHIVLADTVGFVQQLPHDLVEAFRATLDETIEADVLLHVVDANDPERQLRIAQVNEVLHSIGAEQIPQILVYNKIDRLPDQPPEIERNTQGMVQKIWLSAQQRQGMELLLQTLMESLPYCNLHHELRIPVQAGQARARLHELGTVMHEEFADNGDCLMEIEIEQRYFASIQAQWGEHIRVLH